MTPVTLQTRELAARENDGIHVLLLWHPRQDAVTVSVDDTRGGHRFDLAVARDRALEAFHHPFAYAASRADRRMAGAHAHGRKGPRCRPRSTRQPGGPDGPLEREPSQAAIFG